MRRSIRLKEPETEIDIIQSPSEAYLKKCNNTLRFDKFRFRTDSNGAILTGNEYKKSLDAREILILGDSFVESSFLHESLRFTSVLERKFLGDIQVFNYGYSGATTLQILLSSLVKLPPIHSVHKQPRIFACIGTSDVDALFLKKGYWSDSKRYSPLLPISALATETADDIFNADYFLPILKTFCSFFDNFGYNLTLVTSPFVTLDALSGETFLSGYYGSKAQAISVISKRKMLYALLRDFVHTENRTLLDIHQLLNGDVQYFYDDRHVNELGSNKVAECFYQYLQDEIVGE